MRNALEVKYKVREDLAVVLPPLLDSLQICRTCLVRLLSNPLLSWFAISYGRKLPCKRIVWRGGMAWVKEDPTLPLLHRNMVGSTSGMACVKQLSLSWWRVFSFRVLGFSRVDSRTLETSRGAVGRVDGIGVVGQRCTS